MENASKALIIAGGILLAIMILSLIVYMSTITSRMVAAQEEKKAGEEIVAFNKEYEAYNKKRMYGTEIITVMRKAMDYNKDADEKINIGLITKNNYTTVKETITVDEQGEKSTNKKQEEIIVLKSGSYNIIDNETELENFFKQEANDVYDDPSQRTRYSKVNIYSALTNFKRSIFKCSDNSVKYYESGRIKEICFEEIKNFVEY